jgi:hypothetical protein
MVYLAQLLCPNRHAILAAASEGEEVLMNQLRVTLEDGFKKLVADKILNRKCELCGETIFHVEVGCTKFKTMAEATPWLKQCEAEQLETQKRWKTSGN